MIQNLVSLFLLPTVSVYALATIAAWLLATTRRQGVIYAPGKLLTVYRPVILAFLAGFFPAAILAAVLMPRLGNRPWLALILFAAGLAVTGALTHRDLLRKVHHPRRWSLAIAAVTLIAALAGAWLVFNAAS